MKKIFSKIIMIPVLLLTLLSNYSEQVFAADKSQHASPGSIVLMHAGAGAANTPAALPKIIKGLKKKGYQFVTIPKLLNYVPKEDKSYVVKAGDTLENMMIIPEAKPITTQYTVRKGDTLSKIAREYGVTVSQLAELNNIKNINLIFPNQVLMIP